MFISSGQAIGHPKAEESCDTATAYCHIAQQAAVIYFAARYPGYDAHLYDASSQDWIHRPELPVENSDGNTTAIQPQAAPYLAESPYNNICAESVRLALPFAKVICQTRSKTLASHFGGLAIPSALAISGILP